MGFIYISHWAWWVKIIMVFTFIGFILRFIEAITYFVCQVSPNYKIVFWSFIIITILQYIGFFANSEEIFSKIQLLPFVVVAALGTMPILKSAYFYVSEHQEEYDNELKRYNDLKNSLNDE
jgi:hypothetical protein